MLSNISARMRPVLLALLMATLVTNTFAGTHLQRRSGSLPANLSTLAAEDFKLDDNKPSERTLRGGDSHAYTIKLKVGQYLKVVVEQIGIDVNVRAVTPVGLQVVEVDSLPGTNAAEIVELIADSAGTYSILIRPSDKTAAAGRYRIRVAELRAATTKDYASIEARKVNSQVRALLNANKLQEAQPLAEHALALREQASGRESSDVAEALFLLAGIYRARSLYDRAEPAYARALEIYAKTAGSESLEVATLLTNLAALYGETGDYDKAEKFYNRALTVTEKVSGPDSINVTIILNNLGNLYRDRGDYVKAEPLYSRALAIREKALGAEHPLVASTLNNLALVYEEKGDYEKAEPLFLRTLQIREKSLGAVHPEVAGVLNNLAALYLLQNNLAKAEPLLVRASGIAQQNPGTPPRLAVEVQNNLGYLYSQKKSYDQALKCYNGALQIREKLLGANHPAVAESLNNIAALYMQLGSPAKAEPYYLRALSIAEQTLGKDHPYVAFYLSNVADMYRAKGDVAKAIEFQGRCNDARERDFARNLLSGSERQKFLYLDKSALELQLTISLHINSAPNDPKALRTALKAILQRKGRALDAMTDTIATLRRNASEEDRQTLDKLNVARSQLSSAILTGAQNQNGDGYWANIKTLEERVEELENRVSARSAVFRAQSQPVTIEAVQKTLPKNSALIEFVKYKIRPEDVQRALPSKSETVDMLALPSGGGRQSAPVPKSTRPKSDSTNLAIPISAKCRYVAYILRSDGEPAWVNLGEAKPIEDSVDALRQALCDRKRADVKTLARQVDSLVMQPIRKVLEEGEKGRRGEGEKQSSGVAMKRRSGERGSAVSPTHPLPHSPTPLHIFLSPDGSLNLIPFAALVDERGNYLVERYSFTYLTSGRDLLRLQNHLPSKEPPVVIAGVDFDTPVRGGDANRSTGSDGTVREARTLAGAAGPRFGNLQFEPLRELPSSIDEANTLKRLLKNATVWTKKEATETALKEVSSPSILHIATHGFFIEDGSKPQATVVAGTRIAIRRTGNGEPLEMKLRNPLLRSGLFLAGANVGKSGNDDGVLTALEAAGLDLSGTKLVVLSACDTGLGEVRNGEGVYGLRRALVLAGSETQVISLWAVSDEGTRELMAEYYRRLEVGEGRDEALRQTQLKFLANPNRRHPFFWASFIQSGEWANLDGKR